MQPRSHDAFKREMASDQWFEQAKMRPDIYHEPEDQWAILRHEVEGGEMQRQGDRKRSGWERDTDEEAISAHSSFEALNSATHDVDIVVVGVGGGGMNAINRMIDTGVRGVRFVAMNTDAQVLALCEAPTRICLGQNQTRGLGAGGNASVGMRAATESTLEIQNALGEADLVFIAAGMGGGTGTGAAPVVASIAKKLGALTVGIVTLPFTFEGSRRRRIAEQGIAELRNEIDALITVPNDRLLTTVNRERSLSDAFKVADDVLRQGVQGIAEVINVPGMVNVDFADVRSVLSEAGTALMSIGQGKGRSRAQIAAEEAIAGGFLNVTIRGAKRVLFNISGGEDMTLFEVNEVAERIGAAIDDSADIIFGAVIDPSLGESMRVTLIAAGMEELHTGRIEALHRDNMYSTNNYPRHTQVPPTPQQPYYPTQRTAQQLGQRPGAQPNPGQTQQRPLQRPAQQANPRQTPQRPIYRPTQGQAPVYPTHQPVQNPITPPQSPSPQGPVSPPPTRVPPPLRPAGTPPGRAQRSLNDLRGIRSMGRRQQSED